MKKEPKKTIEMDVNQMKINYLINKLTVLLIFLIFTTSIAHAQNINISINEVEKPLQEILKKIEAQSKYKFFYNTGLIDVRQKVTFSAKDENIQNVLQKLFQGTNISFRIIDDDIVLSNQTRLKSKEALINVKGVVVDANGVTLPGVSVIQKSNNQNGVTTNIDGEFSIKLSDSDEILVFSYIGFEKQEIKVDKKTDLTIVLKENTIALDEIVAIGYGTVKRSSVTGSISSIKADELPKSANASVNAMLSGKASGLQVQQTSAQPGGGISITIRGAGSVQAGNEPLYVIDGFPINNSSLEPSTGDYNVGKRDPLNTINPEDIESIEILKDAASTAIYGARAANGVILITTKRGQEGNTKVDVSYNNSIQQIDRYFDMLDAKGFMEYSNILGKEQYLISSNQYPYGPLAQNFDNYVPLYKAREIAEAGKGTDWWNEVTRLGKVNNVSLSISGGNKKTNFLISANYFDQKGLVINSDFKRFTSRLNLDHKINDQIKVGVSATGSYVDNGNVQLGDAQWQASGVLVAALQMSPVAPIYDATGAYYINPKDATLPNPVSYREIDDNTIQKRLLANSYIEYSPLKGLTLKSSVGVDNKSGLRSSYLPSTFLHGAAVGGKGTKEIKNNMDLLFNATASYNTLLNEKHNVGALIGYEFQKFAYDGFSAIVTNFYTDAFGSNNLGAAQGIPSVNSSKSQNVLASYFTR
ncbi:MAG: SusC/RagA family TonB-linked outer membrane protein, partial [Paludibacteraceae bacterium]